VKPGRYARIILAGVACDRETIRVSGLAWFFAALARFASGTVRLIRRMNLKKLRALHGG
jgi:hypothetical protein